MAQNLSSLFSSGTPSSVTANTTTTSEALPDWLQEYTRATMAQGTGVFAQPYQQYTGQRIAGLDEYSDINNAFTQQRNAAGTWQPSFNTAQNLYGQAAQTMPQGIQNYMNPYQDAVVDRIGELGTRNLTEQLLPQVNSTFTGAGQFGSTRNADFTNRALRDVNENVLSQQNQALQQGYTQAGQAFTSDMQRLGQLGQAQQAFGKDWTNQLRGDAASLENIGKQQMMQDQQSLDLGYNQFLELRDYPKTQLEYLHNIIRGLPMSKSSFSTSAPVPNAYSLAQQSSSSPLTSIMQALGTTGAAANANLFG